MQSGGSNPGSPCNINGIKVYILCTSRVRVYFTDASGLIIDNFHRACPTLQLFYQNAIVREISLADEMTDSFSTYS